MDRNNRGCGSESRRTVVAHIAGRERVRSLAALLGMDAQAVAEGLLEAVANDPSLPSLHVPVAAVPRSYAARTRQHLRPQH